MEEVISTSRNYSELTYVWKSWRDVSGAKMREDYKKYVDLSNLAAQKNGGYDAFMSLTFKLKPSLPYSSLPCPSLPFPSLPFPSLPFPTRPFPFLPFPSLPFPSQQL
jgi:hypothetical protein